MTPFKRTKYRLRYFSISRTMFGRLNINDNVQQAEHNARKSNPTRQLAHPSRKQHHPYLSAIKAFPYRSSSSVTHTIRLGRSLSISLAIDTAKRVII